MRELRAVSATLPDVSRHGGGGAVSAWAHRGDEGRACRRRTRVHRVRSVHGNLRAVSRLRTGVPLRSSLWSVAGGSPYHARPPTPHHTTLATSRIQGTRAPSSAACGIDAAGIGATTATRTAVAGDTALAVAAPRHTGIHRRRRVVVHRLCDGRLAAADASQHCPGAGSDRHVILCSVAWGWLLWCPSASCRPRRSRSPARARNDAFDAR